MNLDKTSQESNISPMKDAVMDTANFLDRFKWLLIGTLFIALVAIGGTVYWFIRGSSQAEAAQDYFAEIKKTEELGKVVEKYPGTPAAAEALLLTADEYYEQKNWDKALQTYRDFTEAFPKHDLMPTALMGLAASHEAKGNISQAIETYRRVFEDYSDSYRAAEARLALAQLYEAQGQMPLARQTYQSVIAANPQSQWRQIAQAQLQRIETMMLAAQATNRPAPALPPTAPSTNIIRLGQTNKLSAKTNMVTTNVAPLKSIIMPAKPKK